MNTKLTLRLEEELINSAKKHASLIGKSVSQMVADYFYVLDKKSFKKSDKLSPLVNSLKGSLKDNNIDENDYKSYLEKKYL